MSNSVTIKDVAKAAGLSVATVSRVLSGKIASPKSRALVEAAVKELGYTPNGIARSLRMRRQGTVAVMVSDVSNPYFGLLARSLQNDLSKHGFTMIIGNTSEEYELQEEFLSQALEHRVDGMILVLQSRESPALKRIIAQGIPVVFVDRTSDIPGIPSVECEPESGMFQALKHLKDLGHDRIGLMLGPEGISTISKRKDAFLRLTKELNLTGLVTQQRQVQTLIDANVSAVIFSYTPWMWPALRELGKCELSVPRDLSVIGYDDLPIMEHLNPPMTTIAQDVDQMSRLSVEKLSALLEGHSADNTALPSKLIVRKTTASPSPTRGKTRLEETTTTTRGKEKL